MKKFLNFIDGTVSVDSSRAPDAHATTFKDFVVSLSNDETDNMTCSLDGNEKYLLLDDKFWYDKPVSRKVIDELFWTLTS